jgi:hypothetical protein
VAHEEEGILSRLKKEKNTDELERIARSRVRSKLRRELELMVTMNSPLAIKDLSRRHESLADGCYQARRHHDLHQDDEFVPTSVFELARESCTCQPLDEDELQEQLDELIEEQRK